MKKDTEPLLDSYSLPNAEDFQADYDFTNATLLGSGSFGKVYKAALRKGTDMHAVKIVETINEETYLQALKEIQLNRLINIHPNVIFIEKVYAWSESMPVIRYVLVFTMKLAEGSLRELRREFQEGDHYTDSDFMEITSQLVTTFEFLMNEKHLYHRDIKPDNILYERVGGRVMIKIADFGVSKALQNLQWEKVHNLKNTLVGTPLYLSPKLWQAYVNGQGMNVKHNLEKSDVFSLGVTLLQTYLMLSDQEIAGLNEDKSTKAEQLLGRVQNNNIKAVLEGMLKLDEKQRHGWAQVVQVVHPERTIVDKQALKSQECKYLVPISYDKTYTQKQTKIKLRLIKYIQSGEDEMNVQQLCGQHIVGYIDSKQCIRICDMDGQGVIEHQISGVKQLLYFELSDRILALLDNNEFKMIPKHNEHTESIKITSIGNNAIQCIHSMINEMVVVGLSNGQVCILDFSQHPVSQVNSFCDHHTSICSIFYDKQDELLVVADQSKILSVRYLIRTAIASQKLDYPISQIERINKTTLVVCGTTESELLILQINNNNEGINIEIVNSLSVHQGIPQAIKVLYPNCLICSTNQNIVIYDLNTMQSLPSHLVLTEVPLLFNILHWHQNAGFLFVSDNKKLSKWVIEYNNHILGGPIPNGKRNKGCSCKCVIM